MKTYRNEKNGFEIDIPDDWLPSLIPGYPGKDLIQYGCYNEAFNFEIGPLFPEPLLPDTETEFTLYARNQGFQNLTFGRIVVFGKEHVCAHYAIQDRMGTRWNKKYMVVFGGIEYTITGTCNDARWFANREKDWDSIVRSFRLLSPVDDSMNASPAIDQYRAKRRDIIEQRIAMREIAGDLYARAYEAVVMGQYEEARALLEQCIRETPDHKLAHKELALVLEKLGDIPGAIRHRREVARLSPEDPINQTKLAALLAGGGNPGPAAIWGMGPANAVPGHPQSSKILAKVHHFIFEDHRVTFYSCLIVLLLTDFGLWNGMFAVKSIGCAAPLLLLPVYGMTVSGPWVGLPRTLSGLIGVVLFVLFLILAR